MTCASRCAAAPSCAEECLAPAGIQPVNVFGTVFLVMLSAMFSGLTLGLLSLSLEGLDILISAGDDRQRAYARRIYPLRRRGNLLLCTLLLGNTLVNALIAILSASMTSGLVGGLLSTIVIVIFGEIIPQSICNRHGLRIGAASVVIVLPIMVLLFPFTWPIAKILDLVLGREMGTSYNKRQLDALLEMQAAGIAPRMSRPF
jgi:metal transporter CNNM